MKHMEYIIEIGTTKNDYEKYLKQHPLKQSNLSKDKENKNVFTLNNLKEKLLD